MRKPYKCQNCGGSLYSPKDRFCPWCGSPIALQMSPAGKAIITLLACFGFYALYFAITVGAEFIHELCIVRDLPGFPKIDINEFYSKISERYCEVGILSAVSVLLVFFLIFKVRHKNFGEEVRLNLISGGSFCGLTVLGVAGHFAILIGLCVLYAFFPAISAYSASESFEKIFANANPISEILYLGVITPLLEETLFRGIIYTRLRKILPVPAAIVLSAVAFGAAHGNLEQFVYATFMGLIFAAALEKFDSLWAPFAIHFAFNFSSCFAVLLPENPLELIAILLISAGLFMLTFAFLFLAKNKPIKAGNNNDEAL